MDVTILQVGLITAKLPGMAGYAAHLPCSSAKVAGTSEAARIRRGTLSHWLEFPAIAACCSESDPRQ